MAARTAQLDRATLETQISVELDLLRSAPQLLYTVRDGVHSEIPYAVKGSLGIDIPLVKPVRSQSSGEIRVNAKDR